MRKRSPVCGSFQNFALLIALLMTFSKLSIVPVAPVPQTLNSSFSFLVTSMTRRSSLSSLLALDLEMGGSLHPRLVQPFRTMPKSYVGIEIDEWLTNHTLNEYCYPSSPLFILFFYSITISQTKGGF